MIFTQDDIKKEIAEGPYLLGQDIFRQGLVSSPNIQRSGEIITTVIKDQQQALRVYVRSQHSDQRIRIDGECSCSAKSNCEHVVAVMLQALQDHKLLDDVRMDKGSSSIKRKDQNPASAMSPQTQPPPRDKHVLLYFIQPDSLSFCIETAAARVLPPQELHENSHNTLPTSCYKVGQRYDPANVLRGQTARFISVQDKDLLLRLDGCLRHPLYDLPTLSGPDSQQLLHDIIDSGRCFLLDTNAPVLRNAASRPTRYRWDIDQYGTQELKLDIQAETEVVPTLPQATYVDTQTQTCGPLAVNLDEEIVTSLKRRSPIDADDVAKIYPLWRQQYPHADLPTLRRFTFITQPVVAPVVCLSLLSIHNPKQTELDFHAAQLSFDYGGINLIRDKPPYFFNGEILLSVVRNEKIEEAAYQRLVELGFESDCHFSSNVASDTYSLSPRTEDWLDFQLNDLPSLREAGWRIDIAANFGPRIWLASEWYCETRASKKPDWFDISIGVEIDGRQVDVLPTLLEFIRTYPRGLPENIGNEQPFVLELADGGLLAISPRRMQRIYHSLLELYDIKAFSDEDQLCLPRLELARLAELDSDTDDSPLTWRADDEIQALLMDLRRPDVISVVSTPTGLQAELREYQQRGLDWLQFLARYRFAGILADDMGLGKTIQTLAHLLIEKEQGRADRPSLVIAPTSLMFNWNQEVKKFAPSLKVLTLWGPKRHDLFAQIAKHDLILTTYPLIVRDREKLLAHKYHLLILDEAQVIKNSKTLASREIRKIEARLRLCLTGTPMENHLGELWSLFDFLMPGLLGTARQFQRFFRNPIEKDANTETAERLRRRLQAFMLRRNKNQVAKDLPEKTEIIQSISLDTAQRELYETVRLAMYQIVRQEIAQQGISRSHIIVLDALLKLRQVCCDPRLVKTEAAQKVNESAKLELLMQFIPELVAEGRRILVFSQFTKMLSLIEAELELAAIPYVKLTGQTQDRQGVVERFQSGKIPIFLISLKAGGVGLNLTAADTVIHYDPWWNPATENQATDRAHRIGQKNPVFVYKFICADTVEEKIRDLQRQKQSLADNIFSDNAGQLPQWSEQDLKHLFSPIG
ncbi:MAG: SNF2-related protein [Thiohalomonadales bacterium]